jgi:hypothetical protein
VAVSHEGVTSEGLKCGEENDDEESRVLKCVDNENSCMEMSVEIYV